MDGDLRTRRRIALLPVIIEGEWVWLERYTVTHQYTVSVDLVHWALHDIKKGW